MIRLILSFEPETTTITACAVSVDSGELLAASVLQYKKEATGPSKDLQHLAQYGNHVNAEAPPIIQQSWGDIVHGAMASLILSSHRGSEASAWDLLAGSPSHTSNQILDDTDLSALIRMARASQPGDKPVNSH